MMGINRSIAAVAGHIGDIHGISSQQIIHTRNSSVIVLLLPSQQIRISHDNGIVRHKGIGAPYIPFILILPGDPGLTIGLTVALLLLRLHIEIRHFTDLILDPVRFFLTQGKTQGSQRRGMSPVKAAEGTLCLASGQAGWDLQEPGGRRKILPVPVISGG